MVKMDFGGVAKGYYYLLDYKKVEEGYYYFSLSNKGRNEDFALVIIDGYQATMLFSNMRERRTFHLK